MTYLFLKWLHILSAITALGANLTYILWLRLAANAPESAGFALKGIRFVDRRLANPAYLLVLATGIGMLLLSGLPWTTPWVLTSIILYVLVALAGFRLYAPLMRQQRELAQSPGPESPEYQAVAKRAQLIWALIAVVVVFIVYLMTYKPALWG